MSQRKEIRERVQRIIEEEIGEKLDRVPGSAAWFQSKCRRNFLVVTSTESARGQIWIGIPPKLLHSEESSSHTGKILIAVTPYRDKTGNIRLYKSDLSPFVHSWIDAGRPEERSKCQAYLDVSVGRLRSSNNAKFGGIQMQKVYDIVSNSPP